MISSGSSRWPKYPLGEADQAFLNLYFASAVVRLPYAYNANLAIKKRSLAPWDALKGEMRVVHYTPVINTVILDGQEKDPLVSTPIY